MFAPRSRIRLARAFPIASIVATALILAADAAPARTMVRVGKAQGHRRAAIEVAAKHTGVSPAAADAGYDDTMPVMSTDGRFDPKALNVLATLFVGMPMLPATPEMSLVSHAFLPK
jgi:hypothetical protein